MRVLINFLQGCAFPRYQLAFPHRVSTWSLCIRSYSATRRLSTACFDTSFTIPVGANGRVLLR